MTFQTPFLKERTDFALEKIRILPGKGHGIRGLGAGCAEQKQQQQNEKRRLRWAELGWGGAKGSGRGGIHGHVVAAYLTETANKDRMCSWEMRQTNSARWNSGAGVQAPKAMLPTKKPKG